MNSTLILLELASLSFIPEENDPVSKTHLLVRFDLFQWCLDLSIEFRFEMLRRKCEKYFMNADWLFEWHPVVKSNELDFVIDFTDYDWHFGDPGIWSIGNHLRHYNAIPLGERSLFHIAFRSTAEVEVVFNAVAEYLFYTSRKGVSTRKKTMCRNRVTYLFGRMENHCALINI